MSADQDREFADFVVALGPGLRRTAYVVVRDWHLAEDMTQQGLVKLYAAWGRVGADKRLPYARRVVVNECLSHLRRHRPERPAGLHESLEAVAPAAPPSVLDIGSALALLAPQQRAIVALRFLDDLAVRDVADLLGVAEGTVKSQTSRAMSTLRAHLPELVDTGPAESPEEAS